MTMYDTQRPAARPVAQADNLTIAAFILVFFVPLVGAIMGHVSRKQAKRAGMRPSALATWAVGLGWAFTAIGAVIATVLAVSVGAAVNQVTHPACYPHCTWHWASASAPAAAPSTPDLSGPVGTTYDVSDPKGDKMDVTLTRVIDPAHGSDSYTTPDNGKRFVGAVFALKGVSGHFSDDALNDAALVGSDGQTYTPDFNSIAGFTDWNDGEFSVYAGQRSIGAVTFQVPDGVKVTAVEWDPNSFMGDSQPAEWQV